MDRQTTRDLELLENAIDLNKIYNSRELVLAATRREERLSAKKKRTNDDNRLIKIFRNLQLIQKYHKLTKDEEVLLDEWVEACKEKDFHRSIVLRYFSFEKLVIESKIKYPTPPTQLLCKLNFTELNSLYLYLSKSRANFNCFNRIIVNLDKDFAETERQKRLTNAQNARLKRQRNLLHQETEKTSSSRKKASPIVKIGNNDSIRKRPAVLRPEEPNKRKTTEKNTGKPVDAIVILSSSGEESELDEDESGYEEMRNKSHESNDSMRNAKVSTEKVTDRQVYVVDENDDGELLEYEAGFLGKLQKHNSQSGDESDDDSMQGLF